MSDTRLRVGNDRLVPFARALFAGTRPPIRVGEPACVGPQNVTREALGALQDMLSRGTLAFFVRRYGWRALRVPDTHNETAQTRRMWHADVLGGVQLRFTRTAVDALVDAFNDLGAVESDRPASLLEAGPAPTTTGDLLSGFVLFQRVGDRLERRGPWFRNAAVATACGVPAPLSPLFSDEMRPLLPWVAAAVASGWLDIELRRWAGELSAMDTINQQQSACIRAWIQAAVRAHAHHALVPTVRWLGELARRADALATRLRHRTRDLRLAERQPIWAGWAELLRTCEALGGVLDAVRRTHPIDRTASMGILTAGAERHGFQASAEVLLRSADALAPRLG